MLSQQLASPRLVTSEEVVSHSGAIQALDYRILLPIFGVGWRTIEVIS